MPVGPQILWPENAKKSQPICLHIHRQMPGALRAVHKRGDAELARAGAKFGDRIHRAQRVGDVNHRENLHLLASASESSLDKSSKPSSPVMGM